MLTNSTDVSQWSWSGLLSALMPGSGAAATATIKSTPLITVEVVPPLQADSTSSLFSSIPSGKVSIAASVLAAAAAAYQYRGSIKSFLQQKGILSGTPPDVLAAAEVLAEQSRLKGEEFRIQQQDLAAMQPEILKLQRKIEDAERENQEGFNMHKRRLDADQSSHEKRLVELHETLQRATDDELEKEREKLLELTRKLSEAQAQGQSPGVHDKIMLYAAKHLRADSSLFSSNTLLLGVAAILILALVIAILK